MRAIGLLLIVVDLLSRARLSERALAGVCAGIALMAAAGTHARAEVWSNPISRYTGAWLLVR